MNKDKFFLAYLHFRGGGENNDTRWQNGSKCSLCGFWHYLTHYVSFCRSYRVHIFTDAYSSSNGWPIPGSCIRFYGGSYGSDAKQSVDRNAAAYACIAINDAGTGGLWCVEWISLPGAPSAVDRGAYYCIDCGKSGCASRGLGAGEFAASKTNFAGIRCRFCKGAPRDCCSIDRDPLFSEKTGEQF